MSSTNMRPLKTKEEIYEKFPTIFPQKSLHFHDGWNNLIWDACNILQAHYNANAAWQPKNYLQFYIYHTKEKFGGLRITVGFIDDKLERTPQEAENLQHWCSKVQNTFEYVESLSYQTCEITGQPGEAYISELPCGWRKTLSEEGAKQLGYFKLPTNV